MKTVAGISPEKRKRTEKKITYFKNLIVFYGGCPKPELIGSGEPFSLI